MRRDWGLFNQKHNECGGIILCFSSSWKVFLREAVLIYHKYCEVTVGRNSRALIYNQKSHRQEKKPQELLRRCFKMWRVIKNNWEWGDFTDTNALLLLFPHLHSSLSIMHTQPLRPLIDAWMSRLFPWLHWDPIHFSVFPNAGLKPKHVQSGVAVLQGQRNQEKKIKQFYKQGGRNVYPGNFKLPVSPSSGSDSHLGVMHISFRAEDCLLHNV